MISSGQTLSERYLIKNRIGRGGFATVYLAHDLNFERDVAVKVLSAEESEDPEDFFTTFVQEAKLVAKLLHPNILDVYDYGRLEQEAFLVMPYADGGTVSARLKTGALDLPLTVDLFRQMVAGLAYAHGRNVVHRDLKPQNMLLFTDGRLVISDFGLAKVISQTAGLTNTRVTGTPLYMAPEQWSGQAGKPTDVYALGIILYQLLAGTPPFQGTNQSQLFYQHTHQPLPVLLTLKPDLPEGLQPFLEHLTAKDPTARPTAQEIPALLEKALGGTLPTSNEALHNYSPTHQELPPLPSEPLSTSNQINHTLGATTPLENNTPTEAIPVPDSGPVVEVRVESPPPADSQPAYPDHPLFDHPLFQNPQVKDLWAKGVQFKNSQFNDPRFKKTRLGNPRLGNPRFRHSQFGNAQPGDPLYNGSQSKNQPVGSQPVGDQQSDHSRFNDPHLRNSQFKNPKFDSKRFRDPRFENPQIRKRPGILRLGPLLIIIIIAVVILAKVSNDNASLPTNTEDVSRTSSNNQIGSSILTFQVPAASQLDFDPGGTFLRVKAGGSSAQYRNLSNGGIVSGPNKLADDMIVSPDKKFAAYFEAYSGTTNTVPTATSAQTGRLHLYKTSDFQEVLTIENVASETAGTPGVAAFSPDGKLLALALKGDAIGFVDLTARKLQLSAETLAGENPGHGKKLVASAILLAGDTAQIFSPDGRYLQVADYDHNADPNYIKHTYLYDLKPLQNGGSLLGAKPVAEDLTSLAFSADGKYLVAHDPQTSVGTDYSFFQLDNGKLTNLSELTGIYASNGISTTDKGYVAYKTPVFIDNDLILAETRDPQHVNDPTAVPVLVLYNPTNGSQFTQLATAGTDFALSHDRKKLLVISTTGDNGTTETKDTRKEIAFYDLDSQQLLGKVGGARQVYGLSADDKTLVTANPAGQVELYNTKNFQKITQLNQTFVQNQEGTLAGWVGVAPAASVVITKDSQGQVTYWQLQAKLDGTDN